MKKANISAIIGVAGAILDTIIGPWCYHITALIWLMCIDFITGLVVAAFFGNSKKSVTGGLNSFSCWKGLLKKACTLLIVAAAYQADCIIGLNVTRTAVVIGFCVAELISICENARAMDILPDRVNKAFDKVFKIINDKEDKNNDDH